MSSTEKSDVLESLISLLEENEKRVDTLAKKIEENSDVFKSLLSLLEEYEKRADSLAKNMDENSDVVESILSLLEENEKRVDSLTKKIKIIEQKNSGNSSEIVNEKKSTPVKKPVTRHILVVDDDKKLTSSFKLILENAGYIVDIANTGFSAHILITKNIYDLVLLDWHLHDVFGDQIAESIEKRHSETKIIFITGYSYLLDEFERENEILLKPIDPDDLLDTIAKLFPNEQILRM